MNIKNTTERILWLVGAIVIAAGTFYVTNYQRDHQVYKEAAAKCSADTSVLGQEIENLKAENEQKELHIENLKSLPL